MEKMKGPFTCVTYADVNTGYISSVDCALLHSCPLLISELAQGWFIHVPEKLSEECRKNMTTMGFSQRFWDILDLARKRNIRYIRFGVDGGEVEGVSR